MASSRALLAHRQYPSRTPAMPYSLVKALRISRFLLSSRALAVRVSQSGRKSRKHSSTTSSAPQASHRRRMRSTRGSGVSCPVGLLGWQRNTMSTSGVMEERMESVTAKSTSACRKCRRTAQPALSSAAAYSAKVGAVTSAVRGFAAHASRKIRSAAPLPQRIDSAGIPSCGASFARSARHRGSG